jgi:hypothetical protein
VRTATAYYSETNVLIFIRGVATRSNERAAKSIRITQCPVDPAKTLCVPKAALARDPESFLPRVL